MQVNPSLSLWFLQRSSIFLAEIPRHLHLSSQIPRNPQKSPFIIPNPQKSPEISIYHPKSPEIPRNLHLSSQIPRNPQKSPFIMPNPQNLKSPEISIFIFPNPSPKCPPLGFFFRPGRFLLCGWILLHLRLGLCGAQLRCLETHQPWQCPLELVLYMCCSFTESICIVFVCYIYIIIYISSSS